MFLAGFICTQDSNASCQNITSQTEIKFVKQNRI